MADGEDGEMEGTMSGGGQEQEQGQGKDLGPVVVDGSNVAWEDQNANGKPQIRNLRDMRKTLTRMGFDPIVIVDAALHHQIDQPDELDKLIDAGEIFQAPAGTDADYFVLETAKDRDAPFVSNDTERDYQDRFTHLRQRRIPFMIVDGHIELYQPNVKQALEFTQES
ncbi:MAG TPA: hypothetical protein VFI42_12125 [Thermomicrobiaceae bacterium]|nr:hypothetical protein [Thermomicrobiaceae bacterium]